MKNKVRWLSLALHCFLVQTVSLLTHALVLQLLCPGHVEGSGPAADTLTVDVTEERDGVRRATGLKQTGQNECYVRLNKLWLCAP